MSVPSNLVETPAPSAASAAPFADPMFDPPDDRDAARESREINARRAQIENPEMLRHLRGL